jgi:flagellar basal-body rod protein FlgB
MSINFESALGIHPQALALREKRGELIASNLANADTPGYKARDMDFKSLFKQNLTMTQPVAITNAKHFSVRQTLEGQALFRNPNQAALDGNTVEASVEQANYAENAVQYQASLQFLNGKISTLMTAIRGQ